MALLTAAVLALVLAPAGLRAEGEAKPVAEPPPAEAPMKEKSVLDDFTDAIVGGQFKIDLRLRFEHVNDESPSPPSTPGRRGQGYAFTERLRLGYGTKPLYGFSVYGEFEDIRAANPDDYHDGVNHNTTEALIADPPDTELNQGYLKYEYEKMFTFIGGRQRIKLDDDRFIGNVGWRQNEQTFDAFTFKVTPIEKLDIYYGYIFNVNRIFGEDADLDFQSDSHIINASYTVAPWLKVVGFGYLLDFDNSPVNSCNTFGFRLTGTYAFDETWSASYIGSFAHQTDAGDSPLEYEANYYLIDGSVTRKGWGTAGIGYEVLGTDDGVASFRTPLATGHAFNGWADVFLTTPPQGLRDLYFYAATTLPWEIKGKVVFHIYDGVEDGPDLGQEFDIVFSKAITKNITILAKYADYWSDLGPADRRKVWLQVEFKF